MTAEPAKTAENDGLAEEMADQRWPIKSAMTEAMTEGSILKETPPRGAELKSARR